MKMLTAAVVAAALTTGGLAGAMPASAATCARPLVRHHAVHRMIRRPMVYAPAPFAPPPPEPIAYREPPPPPPAVYDDDPAYFGGAPVVYDERPYSYGGPWFGGYGLHGGYHGYGYGWGHGFHGGGFHGGRR
jgi:hypothetical protein